MMLARCTDPPLNSRCQRESVLPSARTAISPGRFPPFHHDDYLMLRWTCVQIHMPWPCTRIISHFRFGQRKGFTDHLSSPQPWSGEKVTCSVTVVPLCTENRRTTADRDAASQATT
jgi:hypothetical protein